MCRIRQVPLYISLEVDVVEWSRALDVRLSEWCCSVSMVWVQIPSREEQKKLTALKSNSNTVWFNFQMYIIFSINLVSLVTLRSSGTDILHGCHLLLDVYIYNIYIYLKWNLYPHYIRNVGLRVYVHLSFWIFRKYLLLDAYFSNRLSNQPTCIWILTCFMFVLWEL